MIPRRTLLQMALSGAGLALVGAARAAQPQPAKPPAVSTLRMFYTWEPTRIPHVRVAAGVSGNMILILPKDDATAEGGVLIDSQTCPFGSEIRREGEQLAGKVACLINTHHHADTNGGNLAFTPDGRVIAHAKAKPHIPLQLNRYISQVKEFLFREEDAHRAQAMEAVRKDWIALHSRVGTLTAENFTPTEVFTEDKKELKIGGRNLVLHSVSGARGAHTDNDVVVHLPDDNVVITGGLVCGHVHPVIDRDGGADTQGWIEALDRAAKLCDAQTVVIASGGKPSNQSLISWQSEYLRDLRAAVEKAVAAGATRQQVRDLKPRLRVPSTTPSEPLLYALDAVYDEIKAQRPAPARVK